MSDKRYPRRILPLAITGARTNRGAILQFSNSAMEIHGKKVGLVGDTVHDPKDGEVTIVTGLHGLEYRGRNPAGLGSMLSNGSFIVDAGQQCAYWAEFEDGKVAMFVVDEDHG